MQTPKLNAPQAKVGTKTAASGLSVVLQPKRIEKPSFQKAIWVSRLSLETSNDDISKWIIENTSVKDSEKFRVHKLVKKDLGLSTLKFVSFKVEVSEMEFEALIDPDVWPENVMIREFLKSLTLGDFFPTLPEQKNVKQTLSPKIPTTATNTLTASRMQS